jgi:hypothetical protein
LRGDKIDGEADRVDCAQGGGTDDSDLFGELVETVELGSAMEDFDGVGASEEEPIIGAEAGKGGVEGGEGGGRSDLDGGDEERDRAERFEPVGEFGSLVTGPCDEDASGVKRRHP